VTRYTEGFSHFVTSMTAPVASGWSVRRVGLSPTGKRRLLTAHAISGHSFGISQLLIDTLENRREHIEVVVDEVGLDNWRFAGKLSSEWRKQSEKNEADDGRQIRLRTTE
jgi:predicted SpoU family rRNA methylase